MARSTRTAALAFATLTAAAGVPPLAGAQLPEAELPNILSVRLDRPPVVGAPVNVQVRAVDRKAPVSGLIGGSSVDELFGTSACRAPDSKGRWPGAPFAPGSKVAVSFPHTFTAPGEHSLFFKLDAAGCEGDGRSLVRPRSFFVNAAAARRSGLGPAMGSSPRRALAAGRGRVALAAAGHCRGARARPRRRAASLRRARRALLCVMNVQRRAHSLRPLRSNRRLLRAAWAHSRSMVRGAFFSHVQPGGVGLARRVQRTGYMRGARGWLVGENIGFGRGRAASPLALVRSWMRSTAHRANILSRTFREVGLGIQPGTPGRPRGRGVTYTTDFGYRRR